MGLDRLVGVWDLTMHHVRMTESVVGRCRYDWVLDGAFVMLRSSYEHPDIPDAVAIMDTERHHYFDVRGVIRVFDFAIDDSGWTMTMVAREFSQRSTARFLGFDRIEVSGELSEDEGAHWVHDWTMSLSRADG